MKSLPYSAVGPHGTPNKKATKVVEIQQRKICVVVETNQYDEFLSIFIFNRISTLVQIFSNFDFRSSSFTLMRFVAEFYEFELHFYLKTTTTTTYFCMHNLLKFCTKFSLYKLLRNEIARFC